MGKNEVLIRQLKFIAEAKKGNYPNAESFSKKLLKYRDNTGEALGCSPRTIARDIQSLIQDFHAPLEYNPENHGYVMTDPYWEFNAPVFEEDFVKLAMLGTSLAKDILPPPLDREVDDAIAQTLATNNSDFFDRAMLDSIFCASGVTAAIKPEIFKSVYTAWRYNNAIHAEYLDAGNAVAEIEIEPHALVFYRGDWYICGYRKFSKEIRALAISGIRSVRCIDVFVKDRALVGKIREKGFFDGLFQKGNGSPDAGKFKKNHSPVLP